ncbi:hypothetical protein HYQ46_006711 [Verticillium longisporum]|nr:hypothetical protein HYQ46_006711 [Verticillium longisporum]
MAGKRREHAGRPAPVLQHLRRRLNKVPDYAGAVESAVLGAARKVVDAVAQLVEQRDDLIVLQQRRLLRRGLAKVADQRRGGLAACPYLPGRGWRSRYR